ncbi:MAG: MFS transporter [Cyanobacteria bacterium J06649_4]
MMKTAQQIQSAQAPKWHKFGLLGSLYVSQHIPLTFANDALPVFLRSQNVSLSSISLLSLLALPLVFKCFWSPLIDRFGFTRWGHYRFWILCFQGLLVGAIALLSFLDSTQQFIPLLMGLLFISIFSASQDIATDALAVGLLSPSERGFGNGIQKGGNSLGAVIGGGGMLILLGLAGWRITLLVMAGVLALALIPVVRHREQINECIDIAAAQPANRGGYKRLFTVFRRPGMGRWFTILVLYGIGPYMALTMFRPLLVDLGLSLGGIGLLLGVASYAAGAVGSLVAGLTIAQLGRKRSLVWFSGFQVIAIAAYASPTLGLTALPLLYLIAMLAQFINSMAITALFTVMMDKSDVKTAGTDYTAQSSVIYISGIVGAVFSGIIAQSIGYGGVFLVALGFSLLTVIAIIQLFPKPVKPSHVLK